MNEEILIHEFLDWLSHHCKDEIEYKVWDYGYTYLVMASYGAITVDNCRAETVEAAKDVALLRLKNAYIERKELILENEDYKMFKRNNGKRIKSFKTRRRYLYGEEV